MVALLARLFAWLATASPLVKKMLAALTVGIGVSGYFGANYNSLFAKVDSWILPVMPASVDFSPLSLANYVFPLDTLLNYMVLLGGVKVTSTVIRTIKAFIPTVA